jgi:mevalonate kinase
MMRFPIIARREDIEAFEELIKMAKKYLKENGVEEKMLSSLLKKINDRLNLQ